VEGKGYGRVKCGREVMLVSEVWRDRDTME
jgi:hypothetical protein